MKRTHQLCTVTIASLLLGVFARAEVFLPGTQPNENDVKTGRVKLCKVCHSKTGDINAEPYRTWQGGMMAHASLDPVYLAAQAIANQDVPGVGEYCIRCHSPAGWLEGRSKAADGSLLTEDDKHGVSCTICHRLADPLSDEGKKLVESPAPGYGNAMMVMTEDNKFVFGPYPDSPHVSSHTTAQSAFLASGEICGTCHDVSNPLAANDIKTDAPYAYGIIERTYSEWAMSDYATDEDKRTCQSCHFPKIEGGGLAARHKSASHRDYLVQHGPTGGSIWVQKAVIETSDAKGINTEALELGIEKTKALLKTAAKLELTFPEKRKVNLRATNLTGHKLPTGYIEGRRMWVNMKFMGANGKLIKEIGAYKPVEVEIAGTKLTARTLTDALETRVYECLPGLSGEQARKYGKQPGKSFHFVLNDIITKDSRIPPKGFNNKAFAGRGAAPVGIEYTDGQYWDDVVFDLPEQCTSVKAALIYEPVTMEYIKFLAEENRTDDSGKNLLNAWRNVGEETAVIIATATATP